jgi:tetratricopeptide (TPR) repeat protein
MRFFAARILNRCGTRSGRQVGVRCLLLAVVLTSVVVAAAQVRDPGTSQERRPADPVQSKALVSTNELRAPHDARNAVHQGRAALEQKRYADARNYIARALEIYPEYALALELRGILNLREERLEEACADFQRATEYDPNLGAAYLALGATYNRLGHFQEAAVPLSRAAALLPTAWSVQYEMALAYLGIRNYEAALAAISRAEENNPAEPDNRSSVFYTKGRVLLELKDDAQARAAFEQSIRQDPNGHFAQLSQQQLDRRLSARSVAK